MAARALLRLRLERLEVRPLPPELQRGMAIAAGAFLASACGFGVGADGAFSETGSSSGFSTVEGGITADAEDFFASVGMISAMLSLRIMAKP